MRGACDGARGCLGAGHEVLRRDQRARVSATESCRLTPTATSLAAYLRIVLCVAVASVHSIMPIAVGGVAKGVLVDLSRAFKTSRLCAMRCWIGSDMLLFLNGLAFWDIVLPREVRRWRRPSSHIRALTLLLIVSLLKWLEVAGPSLILGGIYEMVKPNSPSYKHLAWNASLEHCTSAKVRHLAFFFNPLTYAPHMEACLVHLWAASATAWLNFVALVLAYLICFAAPWLSCSTTFVFLFGWLVNLIRVKPVVPMEGVDSWSALPGYRYYLDFRARSLPFLIGLLFGFVEEKRQKATSKSSDPSLSPPNANSEGQPQEGSRVTEVADIVMKGGCVFYVACFAFDTYSPWGFFGMDSLGYVIITRVCFCLTFGYVFRVLSSSPKKNCRRQRSSGIANFTAAAYVAHPYALAFVGHTVSAFGVEKLAFPGCDICVYLCCVCTMAVFGFFVQFIVRAVKYLKATIDFQGAETETEVMASATPKFVEEVHPRVDAKQRPEVESKQQSTRKMVAKQNRRFSLTEISEAVSCGVLLGKAEPAVVRGRASSCESMFAHNFKSDRASEVPYSPSPHLHLMRLRMFRHR